MGRGYRIILADDHVMFRHGAKRILEDIKGLSVVGEAGDGIELLKLLNRVAADMVILDISMPGMRGIETTREIKSIHPEVRVLILTMHKDTLYFQHAIAAGASGYLLKEDADEALVSAVKTLQQGRVYVSPLLVEELKDNLFQLPRDHSDQDDPRLTVREKEVLKLISEGKTSREVADLFSISVRTVQHHRANLMRKIGMKKTADLVKYAIRKGYTDT
jgi:DNA-binding NarL/FixJ family response regulator